MLQVLPFPDTHIPFPSFHPAVCLHAIQSVIVTVERGSFSSSPAVGCCADMGYLDGWQVHDDS